MTLLRSLIVLALTVSAYGVARVSSTVELKRLARLPGIQLAPALEFDRHAGFTIFPDPVSLTGQAAEIQKELQDGSAPESWLRLGRVYHQLGNQGLAIRYYTQAIDRFRAKIEVNPGDALLESGLGEALTLTGQLDQALPHLQRAATLAPEKPETWIALGIYHKERAWHSLLGGAAIFGNHRFLDSLHNFIKIGTEAGELEAAESSLAEAHASFEKAVALGSKEWRAFAERAVFRSFAAAVRKTIHSVRNSTPDQAPLRASLIVPEGIQDLRRAAELDPDDPARLGVLAFLPLFATLYQEHLPEETLWHSQPPQIRGPHAQTVTWAVARLQSLAESDNRELAASAAEVLGCVQLLVFRDSSGAVNSLRSALAVDPDRERAWDLLTLELNRRGDYARLVEYCTDRVVASPSVRNCLFLAKAYERIGAEEKAEWIIATALAGNPNDFHANLGLAALLLKRPNHEAFLGRVNDCLTRAERHIGPNPTTRNLVDLALTRGLYFALSDQPEKARIILKNAQSTARNDPDITAALIAIGY